MLYMAGQQGLVDYKNAVMESLQAYARAGASIIITYFTPGVLDWLSSQT
jgi:porphobilinogen synthase